MPLLHIDEPRLDSDVAYRFEFLTGFMGFGLADQQAVHGAAAHLAPIVPALVDAVYDKLFQYDATMRHFVPKQHGFQGSAPQDLAALTLNHEQIAFRKKHLATYLVKLVSSLFDAKLVQYLDAVGRIHTADAGNPAIVVPLVQVNALFGFVNDALLATIQGLPIAQEDRLAAMRAFTKLLWIQSDLFSRHYVK
jgi:hypothetical protein